VRAARRLPRTASPRPLVVLDGVSLRSGNRLVFRDTTWVFARREQWALVGANGSGKSLFARALAGAVPVVGGEIHYRFRHRPEHRQWAPEDAVAHLSFEHQKAVAGDAPAAARWCSLEAEEAGTVREFLSQESVEEINPFEIVSRSAKSAAAFVRDQRRVLRVLQIGSLTDRRLPSLSTGETRKVLIARALLRRPQLLILDDPFSGLDAQYRIHLRSLLEALMMRRSPHVLLIANHPDELPPGITHVLCVDRCRIVAQGRRRTMLAHPRVRSLFRGRPAAGRRRQLARTKRQTGPSVTELVHLEGVTVRYGSRSVLQDVDWTVRRGEHWALLGPNGAGKSTLLSLVVGDNPQAYANTVRLFESPRGSGEDIWEIKRRIGWVSSELHLHFPETQTCLETVASGFYDTDGCYRRPTTRQNALARYWLARFGLAAYADRPLGSLSAGLQRMTLLARALVKSPHLLVFDEPCQGLDQAHRTLFLEAIESLMDAEAATVIYVTHRQDEIPRGICRVLRLRDGRVVS
jgi:molybdate transport system ATP-binding protein